MKIKVSVIVPIYNTEKYLKKCLDSLVKQTLKEIEIILVNDGSTDNSESIINEYLKEYKNKIIYIKKENGGQGESRNLALTKVSGEYVTFVDSDDYIDKTSLEKLYNKAVSEKADIVACTSHIELINNNEILVVDEFKNKEPHKQYILNNAGPCGKIIKTDIINKHKLYFPKLRAYEDVAVVALWGIYANKIAFIDEPMYYYLIREGSTMKQTNYNEKLTHIYDALEHLYTKSKNKYNEELEWIYIEHLLHAASLRFLKFDKYKEIQKINKIIKEKFPNWKKNIYYKTKNIKYKLICNLFYKEKFKILKLILKNI